MIVVHKTKSRSRSFECHTPIGWWFRRKGQDEKVFELTAVRSVCGHVMIDGQRADGMFKTTIPLEFAVFV